MPRNARIVVPGTAHHVTGRGIRRSPIYYDSENRDSYTEIIGRNCEKFGVRIPRRCCVVPDDPPRPHDRCSRTL